MDMNTHIVIPLSEYRRLQACKEEMKVLRQKCDSLKSQISNSSNSNVLHGAGPSDLNLTLPFEVPVQKEASSEPPPVLKTTTALDSDPEKNVDDKKKIMRKKKM